MTYTVIVKNDRGTIVESMRCSSESEARRIVEIGCDEIAGETIEIARGPYAYVHCDGGDYVGMLSDGRTLPHTRSNAGLICRSRTIDESRQRGISFFE